MTLTRNFRQGSEDWSFAFAGFEWLVGLQEVQVKISDDYDKFRERLAMKALWETCSQPSRDLQILNTKPRLLRKSAVAQ